MDARARLMKRVKTSCPLRSGGAANGQCPKNPMACASQDCIALLLRLTFDREEAHRAFISYHGKQQDIGQ